MFATILHAFFVIGAFADCGASPRLLSPSISQPIVLDDAGASGSGWHRGTYKSCLEDAYDNMFHHDWARDKGQVGAKYTFDPPKDGCYVIEEYHPGKNPNCAHHLPREARVDVDFCKGKTAYTFVDQSLNGGQWNVLGALPFFRGWRGYIRLNNSGTASNCNLGRDCFWVADAFRLAWVSDLSNGCRVPEVTPAPTRTTSTTLPPASSSQLSGFVQAVVDDSNINVSAPWLTHPWSGSSTTCSSFGWKQMFRYLDPTKTSNAEPSLEFPFHPPQDGCYLLEEFHPTNLCSRSFSSEVSLTIHYCRGMTAIAEVDQTQNGNKWNSVGLYPFYSGVPGKVLVSHPQVGVHLAVADAFRFTLVSKSCYDAPTKAIKFGRLVQNPAAVILDDQAAITGGTVAAQQCIMNAYAGGLQSASAGQASAKFVFHPHSTGCYRVDSFHPENTGCVLAAETSVEVNWCLGKQTRFIMPLKGTGNQWITVGHFKFYAGTSGNVISRRLNSSASNEHWVADAYRFTKVSESCDVVPDVRLISLRISGSGINVPNTSVFDGKFTSLADMQIALHDALVSATRLSADSVRLLSLRQGSVIADVEVIGNQSVVDNALSTLASRIGSDSALKAMFCQAVLASHGCGVEIIHSRLISGASSTPSGTPGTSFVGVTSNREFMPVSLKIAIVASAAVLIVGIVLAMIALLMSQMVQRNSRVTPCNTAPNPVSEITIDVTSDDAKLADMEKDEKLSIAGSTATPCSSDSTRDADMLSMVSDSMLLVIPADQA